MRISRVALLLTLLAAPMAADQVNRVVLRVNDAIATLGDYAELRAARLDSISRAPELSAEQRRSLAAEAAKQAMRELFDELLVLSRAQQLHIQPSPAEIDRAVGQARQRFGIDDDEQFAQALAQSGMTVEDFRRRITKSLLTDEVLQREVRPKIKVDDELVTREYHAHPERYQEAEKRLVEEAIVRSEDPRPSGEERDLARRIRDGLTAGGRVAELVKELGAEERVIVLEHGWIERGALDGPLDTAVWELDAGGVAGPLEGRGGLHVLHVVEIHPAGTRPLEGVREEIRNRLLSEQYERASRQMLDDVEATAYIVENIPAEAAGYREASVADDPVRALLRGSSGSSPESGTQRPEETGADASPSSPPAQN